MSYSDVMKWEPSPTGRGRRRSRDAKGNQEVGDFRFTIILELFSIYFFFSITLLYHFFSMLFLPTTFTHTHTHDPRPLHTTHDPRHLATLDLARAKSEALFNIYSLPHENIKSFNT